MTKDSTVISDSTARRRAMPHLRAGGHTDAEGRRGTQANTGVSELTVAYPTLGEILSIPLPSRLRRLTQPVTSPPNWFSTPLLPRLACI